MSPAELTRLVDLTVRVYVSFTNLLVSSVTVDLLDPAFSLEEKSHRGKYYELLYET